MGDNSQQRTFLEILQDSEGSSVPVTYIFVVNEKFVIFEEENRTSRGIVTPETRHDRPLAAVRARALPNRCNYYPIRYTKYCRILTKFNFIFPVEVVRQEASNSLSDQQISNITSAVVKEVMKQLSVPSPPLNSSLTSLGEPSNTQGFSSPTVATPRRPRPSISHNIQANIRRGPVYARPCEETPQAGPSRSQRGSKRREMFLMYDPTPKLGNET
jgi:hypothetical protein